MTGRPVRDCPHPRARHEHGTRQAYTQDRCRCLPCRLAAHHANRAYRTVGSWTDGYFPSAVGVQRRIEALHAAGWASTALAARLGVTRQAVRSLQQRQAGSHALASTHAAVAALYDELWDQAPTGRYTDRTRRWAAARGFVPALAWDDIDDPTEAHGMRHVKCSVPECPRGVSNSGMCNAHYLRARRHGDPKGGGARRFVSDEERLTEMWARIVTTDTGCWLYTGPLTGGYGTHHYQGKNWRVHRLVYTLQREPLPDDMQLDHLCHSSDPACSGGTRCAHRACCNPDHLEPVTHAENVRRGTRSMQTHCKKGHEYDAIVRRSNGRTERACSECRRESQQARYERTPRELKPCGTVAAARRHYRAGEPLCAACRAAQRRRQDAA